VGGGGGQRGGGGCEERRDRASGGRHGEMRGGCGEMREGCGEMRGERVWGDERRKDMQMGSPLAWRGYIFIMLPHSLVCMCVV